MIHPKLQTPYKYRPKEWQLDSSNVKTAHVQYLVNGILLTRIPYLQARKYVDEGKAFVISDQAIGSLDEEGYSKA